MCKRNDGVTSAWVILYLEEDLVAVEEIKEQPADGKVAGIADDCSPVRRTQAGKTAQKEIADAVEADYSLGEIDGNGVHSDDS